MPLIPARFLFKMAFPCAYRAGMPRTRHERMLNLAEDYRLKDFPEIDGHKSFADVRCAWNEMGIGLQVEVRGKDLVPQGNLARPRGSDGLTVWIDTRDARTSHRATRFCHQFYFLPAAGGAEGDEPACGQLRINRALQDAPLVNPSELLFRSGRIRGGYWLEAFLPAGVLNGFDPEQNARLGFFYAVKDAELGEQTVSVSSAFPYQEDPSLWTILELTRPRESSPRPGRKAVRQS